MMNIKRTGLTVLLALLITSSAFAQLKIGYTTPNRILSQMPEVEQVNQQIQDLLADRSEQLNIQGQELRQMIADYEAQRNQMSDEQRQQTEQDLLQRDQDLQTSQQSMYAEIQQRQNELMRPIVERMNNAIKAVADENGIDLVINQGTSQGESIIFYAASNQIDITEQVLAKLQ